MKLSVLSLGTCVNAAWAAVYTLLHESVVIMNEYAAYYGMALRAAPETLLTLLGEISIIALLALKRVIIALFACCAIVILGVSIHIVIPIIIFGRCIQTLLVVYCLAADYWCNVVFISIVRIHFK